MGNAKRYETYALRNRAPCEAASLMLGRAEEKSSTAPPSRLVGESGGYTHIRGEVE